MPVTAVYQAQTPEQKLKQKQYQAKYFKSDKGKSAMKKYQSSDKGKARIKRYRKAQKEGSTSEPSDLDPEPEESEPELIKSGSKRPVSYARVVNKEFDDKKAKKPYSHSMVEQLDIDRINALNEVFNAEIKKLHDIVKARNMHPIAIVSATLPTTGPPVPQLVISDEPEPSGPLPGTGSDLHGPNGQTVQILKEVILVD